MSNCYCDNCLRRKLSYIEDEKFLNEEVAFQARLGNRKDRFDRMMEKRQTLIEVRDSLISFLNDAYHPAIDHLRSEIDRVSDEWRAEEAI
jgi:hypothetical protein